MGPGEHIYSLINDDKQIKMINPTLKKESGSTYRRSRGSLYTLFSLWTSSSLNSRNDIDSIIALELSLFIFGGFHPYCGINTLRVYSQKLP